MCSFFQFMSVYERAQDIFISTIFGLIIGIMLSLWASVFDHLFLQNASRDKLLWFFSLYTLGLIALGVILFFYARKFGRQASASNSKHKQQTKGNREKKLTQR